MQAVIGSTYSDWLQIASEVKANGLNDRSYNKLKAAAPLELSMEWSEQLFIQTGNLLRQVLEKSFCELERKLNQVIQYGDAEFADRELKNFHKKLKQCFFYKDYPCLPGNMKKRLSRDICENVRVYEVGITKYLKNAAMDYPGHFTEDILYLFQKRSFYGYVRELMKNSLDDIT
ncbi:hypothetical protein R2R35_23615 [Anaerocolumna sp. AGMB13020]|uniref:hypothetical protein n=1 Tax=Anaerocolumna sp. AGMB13020 TaxID=3081750 RepID=UPI0029543931|nr:hypothetical protein [Anaerocolumna sp. AGMB13020]WOO36743.1 hypothetical protein R2R35_23615 [Anaerocolumna sp. AGMB13020]